MTAQEFWAAAGISDVSTEDGRQVDRGRGSSKYRPEIDGLRAFAVVAVIINHFNKDLLPSGYLGVDIFFVISGYVITSSLAGRESKNFLDFLTGFYERRIKRLVPALVVFVLITSVLICFFNPDPDKALKTGGTSLFGFSNLYLLKQSTDYFAASTELNPFTHTWSLGVEEQFYLLFPFLIWFSGFGQQMAKGARNLFFWVGALTVASLISFIYLYQVNQPAAYFLMPPRFWEMAAGCLIFIGFQKRAKIEHALEQVPPLLVVAAMVGVMFLPVSAAVPATISVVALSTILIACLKKGTAAYDFFTLEKVVYVGLISYSLYLWHWGVLSISRWTIGIHWWSVPIQLLVMYFASTASYDFIELPLRNGKRFAINKRFVYASYGVSIALMVGLIKAMATPVLGISIKDLLFLIANPTFRLKTIDHGKGITQQLILVAPEWGDGKVGTVGTTAKRLAQCHISRPVGGEDFSRCLLDWVGRDDGKGNIYIFGDSHAANYAFGWAKAFPEKNVSMITTGWGCGYIPIAEASKINNSSVNCPEYIRRVDLFVQESLKAGDLVVIGNVKGKSESIHQYSALKKIAENTAGKDAYFVLLDDVPPVGDPLRCLPQWYRPIPPRNCKLSITEVNQEMKSLDLIGSKIQANIKNSIYMRLRQGLCSQGECSVLMDGKPLYFNHGHITVEASERLAPIIREEIAERLVKVPQSRGMN